VSSIAVPAPPTAVAAEAPDRGDRRILAWQIALGLAAFLVGIVAGLAQALDRVLPADHTLWRVYPLQQNYYQGLTNHGVMLALVFMFAFMNGFMGLVVLRSLRRPANRFLLVGAFALMLTGTVLSGWQIVANRASVLFTMYPPLQASWIHYLGLALMVVSTWFTGLLAVAAYRGWRRDHPGERIPIQAFTVLATYAMWALASVGVAAEVLGMLLPWSLGWLDGADPQLARTLFWYSGHPIVYFWLLPAYVSWYTMIPAQVGGRLFSDSLTRLAFLLFLLLSTPTGFHHQYTDPGIPRSMKLVHLVLTFGVFFPSMITAFSVMAALEDGGRARGGRGLLGWIRKLPWRDPSVVAQILAMLAFTLGGVSGLVNASYDVNLVVHNTAWVPGHFHLTVGTAVTLTFLGICYWLVPHLSGRALRWRGAALAQAWLWFVGVLIFSRGQIEGGLLGLPRRLQVSALAYDRPAWASSHLLTAVGGSLMFVSGILFFAIIAATLLGRGRVADVAWPVSRTIAGPRESWTLLDRWPVWIGFAALLILLAYGPWFASYVPNFTASGVRAW
jgi:cytochrome c oxidase subunit 1